MIPTITSKRRAAAGAGVGEYVPISDGSSLNFEFDSLTGFTDNDAGTGQTTQTTEGGETVFKLATGTGSGSNRAYQLHSTLFTAYSATEYPVISARLKIPHLSSFADYNIICALYVSITAGRWLNVTLTDDFIRYKDYDNVTKTVVWTLGYGEFFWLEFPIDKSSTPWTADIQINGTVIATGIEVGQVIAPTSGAIGVIYQNYANTTNYETFFDKLLVGGHT